MQNSIFRKNFILILGFLLLGILIGIYLVLILLKHIQLSSEFWGFTLFGFVQFVATVFIALFVTYYLKNRHSNEQIAKGVFLNIVDNICKTFESESNALFDFMAKTKKSKKDEREILLLLRRISNKISVLEEHQKHFSTEIKDIVVSIRNDSNDIKCVVTGDDFVRPKSFSDESVNRVLKEITDIIFNLDRIKLLVHR